MLHPILGNPRRLKVFVLVWPFVGAALGLVPLWWAGGTQGDWWAVVIWGEVLAVPMLASSYVCRAAPIATSGILTIFGTIGAAAALTSGLWLTVGRIWLWAASWLAPTPYALFDRMTRPAVAGAIVVFALMSAVHYTLTAADARQDAVNRALEAELSAREAELRALRAQVDPHFLFNCLHSISGLIGSEPEGARWMCLALAEFFRESLRAGSQPSIALASEVALVRRYLDIERRRFGPRLAVTVTVHPDAADAPVPPLLLQPLAENAVRHGIATLLDGGEVTIVITRLGNRVEITIANPYDPDEHRGGTGVGLVNVRARLDATYRGRATLKVRQADRHFIATVSVPVEEAS